MAKKSGKKTSKKAKHTSKAHEETVFFVFKWIAGQIKKTTITGSMEEALQEQSEWASYKYFHDGKWFTKTAEIKCLHGPLIDIRELKSRQKFEGTKHMFRKDYEPD